MSGEFLLSSHYSFTIIKLIFYAYISSLLLNLHLLSDCKSHKIKTNQIISKPKLPYQPLYYDILFSTIFEKNVEFVFHHNKKNMHGKHINNLVSNFNVLLIHEVPGPSSYPIRCNFTSQLSLHEIILYMDSILDRANLNLLTNLPKYLYHNKPIDYFIFPSKLDHRTFGVPEVFSGTVIVILNTVSGGISTVLVQCNETPSNKKHLIQLVNIVSLNTNVSESVLLAEIRKIWIYHNFRRAKLNVLQTKLSCPLEFITKVKQNQCISSLFSAYYNCSVIIKPKYLREVYISNRNFGNLARREISWLFPTFASYGVKVSGYRHVVLIDWDYRYNSDISSFFKPLTLCVWISVFISFLVFWVIFYFDSNNLSDWWPLYAILIEQETTQYSSATDSRYDRIIFILTIWLFVTFILRNHYTLTLYSFITSQTVPSGFPETIEECANAVLPVVAGDRMFLRELNSYQNSGNNKSITRIKKMVNYSFPNPNAMDVFAAVKRFAVNSPKRATRRRETIAPKRFILLYNTDLAYDVIRSLITVFGNRKAIYPGRNSYLFFETIRTWWTSTSNSLSFKIFNRFLQTGTESGLFFKLYDNSVQNDTYIRFKKAGHKFKCRQYNWFTIAYNMNHLIEVETFCNRKNDKGRFAPANWMSLLILWILLACLSAVSCLCFILEFVPSFLYRKFIFKFSYIP